MALVVSLVKPLIRDHNLSRPTKSNSSSPNSIMIMLPVKYTIGSRSLKCGNEKEGLETCGKWGHWDMGKGKRGYEEKGTLGKGL